MIHILEADALKSLAADGLPQLRNVNQLVMLVEKASGWLLSVNGSLRLFGDSFKMQTMLQNRGRN